MPTRAATNGKAVCYLSQSTFFGYTKNSSFIEVPEQFICLQEGQRFDGVERIEDDGTIYFTEKNMAILKETLGYECKRMPISEIEDRAKELRAKYLAFAQQFA